MAEPSGETWGKQRMYGERDTVLWAIFEERDGVFGKVVGSALLEADADAIIADHAAAQREATAKGEYEGWQPSAVEALVANVKGLQTDLAAERERADKAERERDSIQHQEIAAAQRELTAMQSEETAQYNRAEKALAELAAERAAAEALAVAGSEVYEYAKELERMSAGLMISRNKRFPSSSKKAGEDWRDALAAYRATHPVTEAQS